MHYETYNSYCNKCYKNLCMLCEKEHNNHEIIYYGKIIPDNNSINNKKNELKQKIDKINNYIKDIIYKLNKYMKNIEQYYKIYNEIINKIEIKNRNYEILYNIINFNDNDIEKDINKIINSDENNKIINLLNICNKIFIKEKQFDNDELTLIYKINKNEDKIKIFGKEFVNNNKNNCKILYEGLEYKLQEYFPINRLQNKDTLKIKLIGINSITNMNNIFYECSSLLSKPDIIK